MNTQKSIIEWLEQFSQYVRTRNIEEAKAMFAFNVHAFGSYAEIVDNLEDLATKQWTPIWFNTEGFSFLKDSIHCIVSDDASLVCVLALWKSKGIDDSKQPFLRQGRCTLTLRRDESSPFGYIAVHSHFSKIPLGQL
jgi:SnoaL-like domain